MAGRGARSVHCTPQFIKGRGAPWGRRGPTWVCSPFQPLSSGSQQAPHVQETWASRRTVALPPHPQDGSGTPFPPFVLPPPPLRTHQRKHPSRVHRGPLPTSSRAHPVSTHRLHAPPVLPALPNPTRGPRALHTSPVNSPHQAQGAGSEKSSDFQHLTASATHCPRGPGASAQTACLPGPTRDPPSSHGKPAAGSAHCLWPTVHGCFLFGPCPRSFKAGWGLWDPSDLCVGWEPGRAGQGPGGHVHGRMSQGASWTRKWHRWMGGDFQVRTSSRPQTELLG